MLNAVIIDDEPDAVSSISLLLEEFCDNVKVVATANTIIEGIRSVKANQPDMVFLDIEMPNGNGFDLVELVPEIASKVIFVTAYNGYAIQAIKARTFDYLLKPIDIEELQASIARLAVRKQEMQPAGAGYPGGEAGQKIAITTHDGYCYLAARDIIHLKAEGSYTTVYTSGGKQMMVSKNLKEFESLLEGKGFLRIHNSHIINLDHVHKYSRSDGGFVVLSDNSKIEISRNRKDSFLKMIGMQL